MFLKMYSFVLFGVVALGEPTGVFTGVVYPYVTGTSFVSAVDGISSAVISSSVVTGRLTVFRNVTNEYGCKLRKGLGLLGLPSICSPGVVDTFLAWFFFLLFSLL